MNLLHTIDHENSGWVITAGELGHIGIDVMKAINGARLDGAFVQEVLDLTDVKGAETIIHFVAQSRPEKMGIKTIRPAVEYYIVC